MSLFAEVILPVPVKSNFTYRIPDHLKSQISVGVRVVAPLGKSKLYTGAVTRIFEQEENPDSNIHFRNIEAIQDESPVLTEQQLEMFRWIAFYYCCTEGEVLNASLPSGLKPESVIKILPGEEHPDESSLNSSEYSLYSRLLEQGELSIPQCGDILGLRNPIPRMRKWEEKGWIRFRNSFIETYSRKTRTIVELAPEYRSNEALEVILNDFVKHPKREAALLLVISAWYAGKKITPAELKKNALVSDSIINTLVRQGYLIYGQEQVDRTAGQTFNSRGENEVLTLLQKQALESIQHSFSEDPLKPVLLQGITGSGKTRIYQELIRETLEKEKQVLYLLPEIGLTRQIIDRMKTEFGERVGVYHSRFNEQERVEIWNKVLDGTFEVVIGVRSAIMLPFRDLGLIVIDEEQDPSFRQHERPPFYHARNVALWYARHFSIPIISGSATPCMETRFHAEMGRYFRVVLNQRAQEAIPPEIIPVDMKFQERQGISQGIFSDILLHEIKNTLEKGEQVILLQNRRGFAPILICKNCGDISKCINCDISLTYHKKSHELKCHYCGYSHPLENRCDACGSLNVQLQGIGTERVEEDLVQLFPGIRILRMDQDTTRKKNAADTIIAQMEQGKVDILVGTQMVSKGLDFEKVSLVGVIQADPMLSFPDFRATEHAFHLLMQVAGRAGRRLNQGKVIIQTRKPDHLIFSFLQSGFESFYEWEKENRHSAMYPPFCRLIRLEIRHKNENLLNQAASALLKELSLSFGKSLLGPEPPLVARIRNEYRLQFLLKVKPNADAQMVRKLLMQHLENFYKLDQVKSIRVRIEVDP